MNQHFTVNSISEAWQKVAEVFPSDYIRDDSSSSRAGYDIYRSTVKSESGAYQWYYCYICDLGCTLEVNLTDDKWNGTTIYINIEKAAEAEEPAQESEPETKSPETFELVLTEEEAKLIRAAVCRASMKNTVKYIDAKHTQEEIMTEFYNAQRLLYHSIINRLDQILGYEKSFSDEEITKKIIKKT